MRGTCRLLGIEAELRESHIFPAFAVDYMKRTGSRFLRYSTDPNIRQQDGIKKYLLSEKAEQLFSVREKWFAEKIFQPYLEQRQTSFSYDDHFYYFSITLLWRVLIMHTDFTEGIKNDWYYPLLVSVEKDWQSFLASYQYPSSNYQVNCFLTDRVESVDAEVRGLDYYISRAFDGTIITTSDQTYVAVYAKFLRFVFWSVLKNDENVQNTSTNIHPVRGQLRIPQQMNDSRITGFFINRANQIANLPNPSEKQQEKIKQEIMKDKEGFLKSDAGRSILNDRLNIDKKENN